MSKSQLGGTTVTLVSHDWSTLTGAGRCAVELDHLLRAHPHISMPISFDQLPPRSTGRRAVAAKLRRALLLNRLLRRHDIQVVVVNTTVQASVVLAARLAGCRVIWWCHESGNSLTSPLMRLRALVYQRFCHSMVAVSHAVPSTHLPCRLIRNIIQETNPGAGESQFMLVLGTKCTRKGIDLLPRILNPDAIGGGIGLAIVGGEDSREHAVIEAAKRRLERSWRERLTWLGAVSDPDEVYRRAAVLLLPSRADPRPRVVEEALARGIPVVASRLPGLEEIAETVSLEGALTLVDTTAAWTPAVLRALGQGRAPVSFIEPFTPDCFVQAWVGAIEDVCGPR